MAEPDEQTLCDLVKRGDRTAMRQMYSVYIRHLTAVCSRYIADDEDVKDILQDTFIKAFSSIGEFAYRGEGSLKAWLTRIAVNESLGFIKSRSRLPVIPIENETMTQDIDHGEDDQPDLESIPPEVIHSFIRRLPDGYRTVFNLYAIEGRSHKEISRLLGISENTSASQLHRAKASLANDIRNYSERYGK